MLGHHRDLVPLISRWHWDEWGGDYPEDSLDGWTAQLTGKTRTDGLPCAWVAFVDDAPVGTVGLELDGVEPRPALKPDLSGLFVLPAYRDRGIGSALVTACEVYARTIGARELYLYTERAETLYSRLGWVTIERVTFKGADAAIMSKRLTIP